MSVGASSGLPSECELLGIKINPATFDELHHHIGRVIDRGGNQAIYNVNVHAMNLAADDDEFREILQQAELVIVDGQGVVFACRLMGHRVPYRITFIDWLPRLADFCLRHGYSLYFLGAEPGVAQEATEALREQVGPVNICGSHHGYFEKTGTENRQVIETINRCSPDILVVGFGMPLQEKWISANRGALRANVILPGGACFDQLGGRFALCPEWMGRVGLNWLFRLLQEPRRLWRRYLVGNPKFVGRFLRSHGREVAGQVLSGFSA